MSSREEAKEDEDYKKKLEALLDYIKHNRGFDFTGYKRESLARRIHRRMQIINISNISDYMSYLENHPDEFQELFNTVLINITSFFRDIEAWKYLTTEVLPKVISSKNECDPIRIWSAGCATGDEAYTIAMLMAELLGERRFKDNVKIFATDIDEVALAQASHASYTINDLKDLSTELRDKYFQTVGSIYIVRPNIRRSVIIGRHNLTQDTIIPHLDLVICRNTLMYFNAETQASILSKFHFALNDPGYIFLGRAELLLMHSNLFTPVNLKCRIFTKAKTRRGS